MPIAIGSVRDAIDDMTASAANSLGDMANNYVKHPE
jgi:hypothetical protein